MLTSLSIENVVLIQSLQLEFETGMTVLTGETGAGKSILLDALGLSLGARSQSGLVRAGEEKATVIASFDGISTDATAFLDAQELPLPETGEPLLIKRTLTKDGKSKAFINGEQVTVKQLQALGEHLVEIHGQHDQRSLLDAKHHRALLDAFVEDALQQDTKTTFAAMQQANHTLSELQAKANAIAEEQEYLQHVVGELAALDPQAGEEEALADQRRIFMQTEQLSASITEAQDALSNSELTQPLVYAERALSRIDAGISAHQTTVLEALNNAHHAISEAQDGITAMERELELDPHAQERTEERLFAIRDLARKHNVPADELPALLVSLQDKLNVANNFDAALAEASTQANTCKAAYIQAATALHNARMKAAATLKTTIEAELAPLKMEKAQFAVDFTEQDETSWNQHGMHSIIFTASTNPGTMLAPLHKVASGGEISRFMLALKVVLHQAAGKTLIFDEVDTGISGGVAEAVGARLQRLSQQNQLLCITHLPQVASFGAQHLRISKSSDGAITNTHVEVLQDTSTKQEEIARLLAGETITEAAREAASELMQKRA